MPRMGSREPLRRIPEAHKFQLENAEEKEIHLTCFFLISFTFISHMCRYFQVVLQRLVMCGRLESLYGRYSLLLKNILTRNSPTRKSLITRRRFSMERVRPPLGYLSRRHVQTICTRSCAAVGQEKWRKDPLSWNYTAV